MGVKTERFVLSQRQAVLIEGDRDRRCFDIDLDVCRRAVIERYGDVGAARLDACHSAVIADGADRGVGGCIGNRMGSSIFGQGRGKTVAFTNADRLIIRRKRDL